MLTTPDLQRNYHKFVQWDITSRCNLQCVHCRSTEFYEAVEVPDLPLGAINAVADELLVNGVRRIHFLGGEPLIRADFCDFVAHLREIGMMWSVNTNATLLDRDMAGRLLAARPEVVTVSLDGPDAASNDAIRGAGVFEKVCRNTRALTQMRDELRAHTDVVISCTLFQQTPGRLAAMTDLTTELGADTLILSTVQPTGRAADCWDQLGVGRASEIGMGEEVARALCDGRTQHVQVGFMTPVGIQYLNEAFGTSFPIYNASCTAARQKGFVTPDGALFPCQSLTDSRSFPAAMGAIPRRSLATHGFEDVWNSTEMRRASDVLFSPEVDGYNLPCRYCRYYRVICYPCPIPALNGHRTVRYGCLEAMNRLAHLRGHEGPWTEILSAFRETTEAKGAGPL